MGRENSKSDTFRIELSSQHQDKSKEELLDEVVDLIIENEKLKKKLRRYENPHTPPSKDERKSRTNFVSQTGLRVGKKTGYKGATRERKEPTDFVNCFDSVCSQCSKHNEPKEIKQKIYEEIPDQQSTKIIKVQWGIYDCKCGHHWESKPVDVPDKGLFGKNMQTQITLLRFDDRLPLRKTISAIERQYKTTLTSKAVYDVTKRVADKATSEYEKIKHKIRRATYLHLTKVIITIKNGLDFWFTRIIHPQIEPTNNNGERSLREMVVMKKIMGTLRNQDGADILAKMMTLISTWRLNGQNPFYSLRALI